MRKKVQVYDFTKDAAISIRDGKIVFDEIEKLLREQKDVLLDFDNVDIVLMQFLDAAIGELFKNHSYDYLSEKLSVVNIKYPEKWNVAIRNGRRKYKR